MTPSSSVQYGFLGNDSIKSSWMAFECSVFTHNCAYGGYELIVFVMSFDILSLEIVVHDDSSVALNFSCLPPSWQWDSGLCFIYSLSYSPIPYFAISSLLNEVHFPKKLASSHQVKFAQRLFELVGDEKRSASALFYPSQIRSIWLQNKDEMRISSLFFWSRISQIFAVLQTALGKTFILPSAAC